MFQDYKTKSHATDYAQTPAPTDWASNLSLMTPTPFMGAGLYHGNVLPGGTPTADQTAQIQFLVQASGVRKNDMANVVFSMGLSSYFAGSALAYALAFRYEAAAAPASPVLLSGMSGFYPVHMSTTSATNTPMGLVLSIQDSCVFNAVPDDPDNTVWFGLALGFNVAPSLADYFLSLRVHNAEVPPFQPWKN